MDKNLVFEYEKYYMDCLSKNKKLLFSRAEEIAMHRLFFGILNKRLETDQVLARLIANRVDVLDDLYRFGADHYHEEMKRLCEKIVSDWRRELMNLAKD